jgi:transposase
MFLKESSVINRSGKRVTYLHLVESQWSPQRKHSTHKFVYSFGKVTELNREKMLALASNILRYLNQGTADLGIDSEILWSRSFGSVYLIESLLKKLGVVDTLRTKLRKRHYQSPVADAIVAMVINRLVEPMSKLGVEDWVKEDIYFPRSQRLELQHYYRALDFLEDCKDEIEDELFWKTRTLFNRRVDVIFYDTTSTYVEGAGEAELLEYGYSRDRRSDRKQIVVGLVTDRDGLPVCSSVFPGNTMDVTTVKGMLERVKRFDFERCVFVCDRGMVSEANLEAIEKAKYEYLVGVKLRGLTEVRDKVLCTRGRFHKVDDSLEVKEVMLEGRRYIICRNPEEVEHDRHLREELVSKLSEDLEGSLSNQQECAIINHPVKKRFVRRLKSGRLVLNKRRVTDEGRYDGKYALLTTDRKLAASELALQYKHLFSVERAFRSLKSGINLRPLYHRRSDRIKAHVSLCVLSYFVQRYAELKVGKSWDVVRRHMNRIAATKILLKNGTMVKRTQLTNYQKVVLNQLDTGEPPLILGS